jgi:hypothetical protein
MKKTGWNQPNEELKNLIPTANLQGKKIREKPTDVVKTQRWAWLNQTYRMEVVTQSIEPSVVTGRTDNYGMDQEERRDIV